MALTLATGLLACNGSSVSMGEPPTTPSTIAQTLPPHNDSASSFRVTVSPKSARLGTTVTVTATLPSYCLAVPNEVSVTVADEELQRAGMAGRGKRVPHQLTGPNLRATYIVETDDSVGKGFIIRCGDVGGDGQEAFEILR